MEECKDLQDWVEEILVGVVEHVVRPLSGDRSNAHACH